MATDTLASGFGGWQADARRARRGCLTAPQGLPDGDLIGARLTHAHTGHPVKPGRALLHTGDGTLTTIAVPIGGGPPPLGGTPARSVPTIPAMAASQAQHRDPSNPADAYRPDQE
jgi:hypothetical protein